MNFDLVSHKFSNDTFASVNYQHIPSRSDKVQTLDSHADHFVDTALDTKILVYIRYACNQVQIIFSVRHIRDQMEYGFQSYKHSVYFLQYILSGRNPMLQGSLFTCHKVSGILASPSDTRLSFIGRTRKVYPVHCAWRP